MASRPSYNMLVSENVTRRLRKSTSRDKVRKQKWRFCLIMYLHQIPFVRSDAQSLRDDAFAQHLVIRKQRPADKRAHVAFASSEHEASPDVVLVSVLGFLDDELSVKQNEAAHDDQPQVHVRLSGKTERLRSRTAAQTVRTGGWRRWFAYLKQNHGSKEHVHQRHQEEDGEAGHECAWGDKSEEGGKIRKRSDIQHFSRLMMLNACPYLCQTL